MILMFFNNHYAMAGLIRGVKRCLMAVMESATKRSGGRPRGFDREAALDTAMRLFWRHGYEGVSFQQLTSTLGLAAPSLYAAFGNKAALYREALDRYAALRGASDLSFMRADLTLAEAVRLLLHGTADGLVDPGGDIGCMLNTGMIASHPDNAEVARDVADRRRAFRELLEAKLLTWVDADRAAGLARFLTAITQGMAIQARDGASLVELRGIADEAAVGIAWRKTFSLVANGKDLLLEAAQQGPTSDCSHPQTSAGTRLRPSQRLR